MSTISHSPRAYEIVDFSDRPDDFIITADPRKISIDLMSGERAWEDLSPADKCLQAACSDMEKDYIAGEDFKTTFESNVVMGSITSQHKMMLLRDLEEGKVQKPHIHPPASKSLPDTSIRHVLLYSLYNKELPEDEQGVTFSWYGVKNTKIIESMDVDDRYAIGDADGVQKTVHLKPGQCALVAFGKGVHDFDGTALALSLHFWDSVNNGNNLGSFLGNTVRYDGKPPEETSEMKLIKSTDKRIIKPEEFSGLTAMFAAHGNVSKVWLQEHNRTKSGQALSYDDEQKLLHAVRTQVPGR